MVGALAVCVPYGFRRLFLLVQTTRVVGPSFSPLETVFYSYLLPSLSSYAPWNHACRHGTQSSPFFGGHLEALPKPQVDGRGPRKHETGFIFTHSRFKVLCIGSMFPIDIQTLAYFIQHRSMTEGSQVHEPLYHSLRFLDRDLGGSLWDPFPVFDRYIWMISMDGERAVRRTHWRVRGPSSSMRRRSFQPGIESEKQPAFHSIDRSLILLSTRVS